MPGKIKVKILAGRNLPVMDRSGDTTDAYVEIKFGNITYKTDVCRKTLNPQWNSEWYRFEVDDAELQDEPLQLRLMDHDTYSANDAIGKVYLNLNPLLLPGLSPPVKNIWTLEATLNSSTGSQGGSVMTGWIPVFDTMHGIRGEVNIIVKVELFSDFNKFRQSSCGVLFFYSPNVPHGYHAQVIHGFVEELIVSDDPEYKWIDKIRTPRASNEARQTLFFKLSGEVQRKIGLKALDLGGNAVIGYCQNFDLEGESGIVARGIGTAVTLIKLQDMSSIFNESQNVDDLLFFCSQSKNQLECSESDDGLPLISRSPSPLPLRSQTNLHTTRVSTDFPKYDKNKSSHRIMKVTDYKASSIKRQMSLQSSPGGSPRKSGAVSTQSLSDDLISESSLRSMLALEDMRGERTSAFSRGLKNLRYFPRRMIQIKTRISDSLDDESDDSTYSSSWSAMGSDSARSSFSELRQSMRRKKFTHKKIQSDGIAALLIRSVHVGFPLDSVLEDHETPAPSPVNFLEDFKKLTDQLRPENHSDDGNSTEEVGEQILNEDNAESKAFVAEKNDNYDYTDGHIPMISSSETDTSTSDDDEPSESSTNYNILDDSLPFCPDSSVDKSIESSLEQVKGIKSSNFGQHEISKSSEDNEFFNENDQNVTPQDLDGKFNSSDEIDDIPRQMSIPEGIKLDYDVGPNEILIPLISSLSSTSDAEVQASKDADFRTESLPLIRSSSSFKLKLLGRQENIDAFEDNISFIAASTPTETNKQIIFPNIEEAIDLRASEQFSSSIEQSDKPLIDLNEAISHKPEKKSQPSIVAVIRKEGPSFPLPLDLTSSQESSMSDSENLLSLKHRTEETSLQIKETSSMPDSSKNLGKNFHKISNEDESIIGETEMPYKRYLSHSCSLETKPRYEKKDKTFKKVTRTETVIYKGPSKLKPKSQTPIDHPDNPKKLVKAITGAVSPSIIIDSAEADNSHLKLPPPDDKDINIHTPYPQNEFHPPKFPSPQEYTIEAQLMSERFRKKYRQHCMLDLIRTIDVKMMIRHMHSERKDSTRSKKKHCHKHGNATPSPESIHRTKSHRRNSRSKSPERQHHHHHHSHHSHEHHNHDHSQNSILAIHSTPNFAHTPVPSPEPIRHLPKCNQSLENSSKNNPSLNDSHSTLLKNKSVPTAIIIENYDTPKVQEIPTKECILKSINDVKNEASQINVVKSLTNSEHLKPNERDSSVHKSHSEGSLEELRSHLSLTKNTNISKMTDETCVPCPPLIPRQQEESSSPVHPPVLPASVGSKLLNSPAPKNPTAPLHRRSSDSDLSITPKGNSLAGSDRSMGGHLRPSAAIVRTMNQDALEMLEYPFITMQQYSTGFILNLGGLVSARSVKLIERISNLEEPEGRDAWWTEIRMEVRSHARALGCNVVLGYKEEISICDDVCVLNASGTAAVINLLNTSQDQETLLNKTQTSIMTNLMENDKDKNQQKNINNKSDKSEEIPLVIGQNQASKIGRISESNDHEMPYIPFQNACSLCHLPYNESSVPFRVDISKCAICKRANVPDVLFTTIELPDNIPLTGCGVFLQATVCKNKRDLRGELNAKEISDCLPFLEYELHSLLLNKLKVKGMNAIFGLKVQVSIGERLVIGMAVGTAVFLTALPVPCIPKIASGNSWHNEEQLAEIQKNLIETVKKNRDYYNLKPIIDIENGRTQMTTSDTDESDEDLPDLDLGAGTKDACVLEVDDVEDMDRINLLMDDRPPDDFHVVNTQSIPGLEDLEIVRNLQMFTQISRAKIPAGQFASMPSKYFARMLQTIFFKLRRMVPCALCDMQFKVALPEQDEIQLTVVGMALGLGEPTKMSKYKKKCINNSSSKDQLKKSDDNDLIFSLDEDHAENVNADVNGSINQSLTTVSNSPLISSTQKSRPRSPFKSKSHQHRYKHVPLKERYGVDITPLSYLPGGRIERYLGNLNFFFIRESTSIRENGGLSGFTHSFVTEVLAIVRAHITALGGNAMVAFFMTQCVLQHSPHKNQGQCLINVGGDVVIVSYFGNERHNQNS